MYWIKSQHQKKDNQILGAPDRTSPDLCNTLAKTAEPESDQTSRCNHQLQENQKTEEHVKLYHGDTTIGNSPEDNLISSTHTLQGKQKIKRVENAY